MPRNPHPAIARQFWRASLRRTLLLLSLVLLGLRALPADNPAPAAPAGPTSADQVPSPPSHEPIRIGFVDMDIVLQESKAVQEHVGRVEDRLELKKRDIDRKMTEHDRLRESLQRQDSILTEEEKQRRIQRIEELKTEVEDLRYEANRVLRQSERGIIEPILDSVMETVQEVGRREGFDLVLRGELVLYGAEAVDLTDKVIEALDSKVINIPGLSDTPETRPGDTPTSPGNPAPEPSPAPADPLPLIP